MADKSQAMEILDKFFRAMFNRLKCPPGVDLQLVLNIIRNLYEEKENTIASDDLMEQAELLKKQIDEQINLFEGQVTSLKNKVQKYDETIKQLISRKLEDLPKEDFESTGLKAMAEKRKADSCSFSKDDQAENSKKVKVSGGADNYTGPFVDMFVKLAEVVAGVVNLVSGGDGYERIKVLGEQVTSLKKKEQQYEETIKQLSMISKCVEKKHSESTGLKGN